MTRRILAAVLGVTIVAVVALFIPAAIAMRGAQERQELLELQREASIVAGRVPADGDVDTAILEPSVDAEHRLGLYDRDGTLLGGVGPEPPDAIVELGLRGSFAEGYVGDDVVAVVPIRLRADGSSLAIRIEAPRAGYADALVLLGLGAAAIIAIASAVAVWLARRLNRPIEELRCWAAAEHDQRSDPPPPTGVPELDALREALLDRGERIEELLRRERSFSSHVSHQLRTPVAALRVAVETELAAPRADSTELLTEALGQLDRLESTITSLLALARHADRRATNCDLDAMMRDAAVRWRPAATADHRSIELRLRDVTAWCDPAAIGHVLDVLLDNALRHGHGVIELRCDRDGDQAVIEVADEGTRPSTDDVFADADNDSAHGIGLRLARTLVESAHGRLELADTATTRFRLTLPIPITTRP